MKYVSAKHADLVEEYERIQAEAGANCWPERDDAPYRIKSFVMAGPAQGEEAS